MAKHILKILRCSHCKILKLFSAIFQHYAREIQSVLPFNDQCPSHIETGQLLCSANQLTGFYMSGTLVLKGLKQLRI